MADADEWRGPRCEKCGARMNTYGRVCITCQLESKGES